MRKDYYIYVSKLSVETAAFVPHKHHPRVWTISDTPRENPANEEARRSRAKQGGIARERIKGVIRNLEAKIAALPDGQKRSESQHNLARWERKLQRMDEHKELKAQVHEVLQYIETEEAWRARADAVPLAAVPCHLSPESHDDNASDDVSYFTGRWLPDDLLSEGEASMLTAEAAVFVPCAAMGKEEPSVQPAFNPAFGGGNPGA